MKGFYISFVIGLIVMLSLFIHRPGKHEGQKLSGYQWPVDFAQHKLKMLDKIEIPRIILAGGSNLLYGASAKNLSEALNQPVFNFGLGASIGMDLLLKMVEKGVKPGDTVVLMLENELFSVSPYAAEGRVVNALTHPVVANSLSWKERLIARWYAPMKATFSSFNNSKTERFKSIYQVSSLTELGDLRKDVLERYPPSSPFPENKMTSFFAVQPANQVVLAKFVQAMSDKQVKVIAIPSARYVKENTAKAYYDNERLIAQTYENLGVAYLSRPEYHSFTSDQMFDSPNHLNLEAKRQHTNTLINVLIGQYGAQSMAISQ